MPDWARGLASRALDRTLSASGLSPCRLVGKGRQSTTPEVTTLDRCPQVRMLAEEDATSDLQRLIAMP